MSWAAVCRLAADSIKPKDPTFSTVYQRLNSLRFHPFFDNCIGALDGTHIKIVVPTNQVVPHTGRHGYTSQNVLPICDFDMKFTFAVAVWPGSVHDNRVLLRLGRNLATSSQIHQKVFKLVPILSTL